MSALHTEPVLKQTSPVEFCIENPATDIDSSAYRSTFAASALMVKSVARTVPSLPENQLEGLFNDISASQELDTTEPANELAQHRAYKIREKGEEAKRTIAYSFLGQVVTKATSAYSRFARHVREDELIQAGADGLMQAIERFPMTESEMPFDKFISPYIHHRIMHTVAEHVYKRSLSSTEHSYLEQYLSLRSTYRALGASDPTPQDIAADIYGMSEARARDIIDLTRTPVFYDGLDKDGEEANLKDQVLSNAPECSYPTENMQKEILIERALLLLPNQIAKIVEMRIGYGQGVDMSYEDIGRVLGIPPAAANVKYNEGLRELRSIIASLQNKTLDFAEWRRKYPERKNVLSYLALVNVPIPEDKILPRLRGLARGHLEANGGSVRNKMIIASLYGLDGVRGQKLQDIAKRYGVSDTSVQMVEKRFFDKCAACGEAAMPQPEVITDDDANWMTDFSDTKLSTNADNIPKPLTPREIEIISRHHGASGEPQTFPDIAAELGVSRAVVNMAYQKAREKILRSKPGTYKELHELLATKPRAQSKTSRYKESVNQGL